MRIIKSIIITLSAAAICSAEQAHDFVVTNYTGIGAVIGMISNVPEVVILYTNSPAQTAGLRLGDKLVKIDGESVAGKSCGDVTDKLRGAANTAVTIEFVPQDSLTTNRVTVTRSKIEGRIYKKIE